MRNEEARAFPDLIRDRRLFVKQVRRDGIQKPPLGIANHVGIDAAACGRRRQPVAGKDLAEFVMHNHPTARRRVVLVIFHAQRFGQVPLVVDDEKLSPSAQHIREKLPMVVEILER